MEDGFTLSLDAVRAWCERNNIRYLFNEELGQIGIPRPLQQGNWLVRVIPHAERKMMTIAFPLPLQVPRDRLAPVSLALGLANSASFMGCWVLNHAKGEVYFRATLPMEGTEFNDDAMRFVMQIVIGSTEGLAAKIRAVALEGALPQTIIPQPPGSPPPAEG